MRISAALSFVLATTAHADTAPTGTQLTPEQFEAYVTGKTLTYAALGEAPYGAEEYLPNRQVRWAFAGQECKNGQWFVDLDLICFVYEDNPMPQCWSFAITPQGLRAQFENVEGGQTLYSVEETDEPLQCLGPQVGV